MKVKNEYVEIQVGNKVFRKQNMILDLYLNKIFDQQINNEYTGGKIDMCYIKLDTPLEDIDYDSSISGTDFDIRIFGSSANKTSSLIGTKNTIKASYNFSNRIFWYKKPDGTWSGTGEGNFNMFLGRKIASIGFGNANECYTYLDTSNMNIIINDKEKFRFTRVDNIISDGNVNGFDYPLHLVNDLAEKDGKFFEKDEGGRVISVYETTNAQLYSIGFGNTEGLMEEEYLIEDVEVDRDDTSITFDLSRIKSQGIYPSNNLMLGFTPIKDNSKYLIFKYRLYRRYFNDFSQSYVINYLDQYYTMSKLNDNFGNLEVKIKIERV